MAIPKEALDLIKDFEGYLRRLNDGTDRVKPYLCPAGVATIGHGSTRYFPGGARVKITDPPISALRAAQCLAGELAQNENDFDRMTTRRVHPIMRGAVVSFIYNCGSGAYRASNLRRKINAGEWSSVPYELSKWKRGGGRVLAGLTRRRKAEGDLFMRGVSMLGRGIGDNGGPPLESTSPTASEKSNVPASRQAAGRLWEWLWK